MKKNIDLSILYVYYNTPTELLSSVNTLVPQVQNISYEILIVDNASSRPLPETLRNRKDIQIVINKKNVGYGAAMNQLATLARGTYLLISNPDVDYTKGSVTRLLQRITAEPKIGIIGPQIIDKKGGIIPTSSEILTPLKALVVFSFISKLFPKNTIYTQYFLSSFDRKTEKRVPSVTGACMVMPTSVFKKVGGFDTRFFMYFEEIDLCYRVAKMGLQIIYYPFAQVIHMYGTSSNDKKIIQKRFEQSRYEFLKKYYSKWVAIPVEYFLRMVNHSF